MIEPFSADFHLDSSFHVREDVMMWQSSVAKPFRLRRPLNRRGRGGGSRWCRRESMAIFRCHQRNGPRGSGSVGDQSWRRERPVFAWLRLGDAGRDQRFRLLHRILQGKIEEGPTSSPTMGMRMNTTRFAEKPMIYQAIWPGQDSTPECEKIFFVTISEPRFPQ